MVKSSLKHTKCCAMTQGEECRPGNAKASLARSAHLPIWREFAHHAPTAHVIDGDRGGDILQKGRGYGWVAAAHEASKLALTQPRSAGA